MTGEGSIEDVIAGKARWSVTCADCLDVLPTLADNAVDVCLADPPYGIGAARCARGGKQHGAALAPSFDYGDEDWDDEPAPQAAIDHMRRVSHAQIIWGGNYYALPPTSCWLVWDKQNGENNYADCELAWTNMERAVRRLVWQWHGMLRRGKEPRQHPTQKPLGVMLWCLSFVPDAEIILDPFAGSGTTGVAALRLGRRVILIEREPKWADLCRERLRAEEAGSTLQAARAGQIPMFAKVAP